MAEIDKKAAEGPSVKNAPAASPRALELKAAIQREQHVFHDAIKALVEGQTLTIEINPPVESAPPIDWSNHELAAAAKSIMKKYQTKGTIIVQTKKLSDDDRIALILAGGSKSESAIDTGSHTSLGDPTDPNSPKLEKVESGEKPVEIKTEEPKKNSTDSSSTAAEVLSKYMRRPRA